MTPGQLDPQFLRIVPSFRTRQLSWWKVGSGSGLWRSPQRARPRARRGLLSRLLAVAGGTICLLSNGVYAAYADRRADRRTGRQPWIFNDTGRRREGRPSTGKTATDHGGRGMPVEGFEPSTPHGDLFLRQARIPFRHAGLLQGG
jgi:hypothetical protein